MSAWTQKLRRSLVPLSIAVVAMLTVAVSAASSHNSPPTHRHLRILLTNDDGWRGAGGSDTPAIVAMRDALVADGHDVTVVAPATDQGGSGGKMNVTPLEVKNPSPKVWTVGGTPSDSVWLGQNVFFGANPPDLVVSGINPGGNHGGSSRLSGTVAAAITALGLHIPAIAISSEPFAQPTPAMRDRIASYMSDLIQALADRAGNQPVLPTGLGLNVTYPGAPATGARLTFQAQLDPVGLKYSNTTGVTGEPGMYAPAPVFSTATPPDGSDWAALKDGKVSITPMAADITHPGWAESRRKPTSLNFLTHIAP